MWMKALENLSLNGSEQKHHLEECPLSVFWLRRMAASAKMYGWEGLVQVPCQCPKWLSAPSASFLPGTRTTGTGWWCPCITLLSAREKVQTLDTERIPHSDECSHFDSVDRIAWALTAFINLFFHIHISKKCPPVRLLCSVSLCSRIQLHSFKRVSCSCRTSFTETPSFQSLHTMVAENWRRSSVCGPVHQHVRFRRSSKSVFWGETTNPSH